MYLCVCVCVCVCMYIYIIYIVPYVRIYVCMCVCVCMYVYMYICTYVCVCVYIYIYIYIYTHTHTHVYFRMLLFFCILHNYKHHKDANCLHGGRRPCLPTVYFIKFICRFTTAALHIHNLAVTHRNTGF
jgi:hypothetical protein